MFKVFWEYLFFIFKKNEEVLLIFIPLGISLYLEKIPEANTCVISYLRQVWVSAVEG